MTMREFLRRPQRYVLGWPLLVLGIIAAQIAELLLNGAGACAGDDE
jgi:hypothetical protein